MGRRELQEMFKEYAARQQRLDVGLRRLLAHRLNIVLAKVVRVVDAPPRLFRLGANVVPNDKVLCGAIEHLDRYRRGKGLLRAGRPKAKRDVVVSDVGRRSDLLFGVLLVPGVELLKLTFPEGAGRLGL